MQIKLTNILKELEINKPFQFDSNIMKEINIYFNPYFIKWLEKNVTNIDEDLWQYLPKCLDDIKDIMSKDNEFDHDQFDDDMAEEYFNLNMLEDVKKKLWKKYFENVNISKIKKDIYQHIKKYNYKNDDIDEGIESFFRWDNNSFDDMYAPIIVEPFIEEVLEEVISNYDHGEDLEELQVNNPVVLRPFKNNKWERGKNVKETIVNFIRANQYQPANVIVDNVSIQSRYNNLVVMKAITSILNMGVMRRKVTNPNTGRKVFVYYIPQGSLFELQVTNPNKTAEEVYDYFIQNIWDNYNEFGVSTKGWEGYVKIRNKYNISNPKYKYDYQKLSQSDLNKFYQEMKQLVKKYATNNI